MSIETIDTLIVGGAPPKIAEKTCDMTISQSLVTNGFDYSVVNTRTLNNTAPLKFMPLTAPVRSMVLRVALIKKMANVLVVETFVDHCKTARQNRFAWQRGRLQALRHK